MRSNGRRLLFPFAVLVALSVPTATAATASGTPTPQWITGVVQTIIREQPPGRPAITNHASARDTSRVLRVGTKIVPLAQGSLLTTRDGATVSVAVVPGRDGAKRVVSARTISAPADAAIASVHQVYVALVLPAGLTADTSLNEASARAMVARVSQYWSSQTGDKVSFITAQVLPTYRSAYSCAGTDEDTYNMWQEALAMMPDAYGPGKHLVLVAPGAATSRGCYYGLGTIGAIEAEGNAVFVSGLNQSLLAHELGHNLGLYHSNSLRCDGTQDMQVVESGFPGCQAKEYDDLFDVMGYSGTSFGEGNLNAVHLDGMNLLPDAVRKIPANSGATTARITSLSTTTASRTLKITDPSGAEYFVEYRTNSGLDTVAGRNPWKPSWGVRVLRDDPNAPASAGSYELDVTPTSLTSYDYNRCIPVGGTFTSASGKLTLRVTAQDPSGATLTITDWADPIVPSTVTLSAPTKASVGSVITAAAKVSDQHGRAVPNWTVTLQKMQAGTHTWRSVSSVPTSSAGYASHRFANGLSGYYRWVTRSATGAPSRISPPVAVTSTARVIESPPATSLSRGRYLSVHGSVSPLSGPVVYIQYRYGDGPWRTGPLATVQGTAVSGWIALNVRGSAYTRLSIRSTTSYVGSLSNSYVTRVR
jgi:hypothetical protein